MGSGSAPIALDVSPQACLIKSLSSSENARHYEYGVTILKLGQLSQLCSSALPESLSAPGGKACRLIDL